jgi:hypothetical protein
MHTYLILYLVSAGFLYVSTFLLNKLTITVSFFNESSMLHYNKWSFLLT